MTKKSCQEALARVYEFLDNELGTDDAQRVRKHFDDCGVCHDMLQFCTRYKEAIRRAAADLPCAPPSLRARIEEILAEEDRSSV